MDFNNVIEVNDVKKKYRVYYDKGGSLKEKVLFKNRNKYEERWVLKGLNFKVKKGEAIGLIGKNGCGKSTLLKLLTKIIHPTVGDIQIRGRVSSLIELGAGFHPDMTGRENIYTNASIFGLTRKEIDKRMNDIIAFSELEDYLDNPVRTYSSGMYMRLAFSVAINVDADVLLIDEILAVGDISFQTKCFEKLKKTKSEGTTIVIVSHALEQIEQICDRTIWIEEGQIKEEGIPKYIHDHYLKNMEQNRINRIEKELQMSNLNKSLSEETVTNLLSDLPDFCRSEAIRIGNRKIEFENMELTDSSYNKKNIFYTDEMMIIKLYYKSIDPNLKGNFGIGIFRDDGIHCYGTHMVIEKDKCVEIKKQGVVEISISNVPLLQGNYTLDIGIISEYGEIYDEIRGVVGFRVVSNKRDSGVSRIKTSWLVDGIQL